MNNRTTKVIFLLLAFVLPICIFIFLKLFGRNEFDVPPLFVSEAPAHRTGCNDTPLLPYFVPDSIRTRYQLSADSLTVIFFEPLSGEARNQLDRIREQTGSDPVQVFTASTRQAAHGIVEPDSGIHSSDGLAGNVVQSAAGETHLEHVIRETESVRKCIFFLDEEVNVVMLDTRGAIRGQYSAADRDDTDRLLTEITIILKKY